ncbi:hypothetical protein RchiOBHm_Chr2g0097341 [Rosa chinensis]|uniref:Uncharacterized protein n=1 Tax=Rosa chinensis TaxID=74649 RepID=A0A2P6RLE6_ROSCH|nr:hypothetical protein RchiOBHm_Chr2g0097341 [Rosa chinensis]
MQWVCVGLFAQQGCFGGSRLERRAAGRGQQGLLCKVASARAFGLQRRFG